MSETVTVDEKERLVLPKRIREKARIGVNTKLVVTSKGVGRVELSDPKIDIARAQEIGSKKLIGWKEEDHQAAAYLLRSMREYKQK